MTSLAEALVFNAVSATVLALAVALVARRLRHPAVVHALWLLVLVKLVTPPLVEVGIFPTLKNSTVHTGAGAPSADRRVASSDGARPEPATGFTSTAPNPTPQLWHTTTPSASNAQPGSAVVPWPLQSSWLPSTPSALAGSVAAVAVVVGALWILLVAAVRIVRLERRIRAAPLAPPALRRRADRIAQSLGLTRAPRIRLVRAPIPPSVRPTPRRCEILIPAVLWDQLDDDERDTLLAHELAHVRRRDHWIRPLELLVVALYWWHPVAWWARRSLHAAEEKACDALVQRKLPHRSRAYVEALLKTVEYLSRENAPKLAIAPAAADAAKLEERLTMILKHKPRASLPVWARTLVVVAAIGTILVSPGWVGPKSAPAEKNEDTNETDVEFQMQMLAIQREELKLEKQLQELELRRMRIRMELEQSQLRIEAEKMRAKIAALEAEGNQEEADALGKKLKEMEHEAALHLKRVDFEQSHMLRLSKLEFEKRELMMQHEELMARGDEEEARKIEERGRLLERQMRELELEALKAELQRGRERLERATAELEALSKP